jgi:hypothetical protein
MTAQQVEAQVALVDVLALPEFAGYPRRWLVRARGYEQAHLSRENAVADADGWPEGNPALVEQVPWAPDLAPVLTHGTAWDRKCGSTRWVHDAGAQVRGAEQVVAALSGGVVGPFQQVRPFGAILSTHVEAIQRAWLAGTDLPEIVDGFRVECANAVAGHDGDCAFGRWVWNPQAGTASPA